MAEHSPIIDDLASPGEILEEALDERCITHAELARRAGLSTKHVSQLINAKVPLSMDVALQLERVLGIPARLWNSLEFSYRSELKRREQLKKNQEFAAWMRGFPLLQMARSGYNLPDHGRDVGSRVDALLSFFGVASPGSWETQWAHVEASFRASPSIEPSRLALTAWLRQSEIEARSIHCRDFDPKQFGEVLRQARALTLLAPREFQTQLITMCAKAGVAVTFVPSLPKLAISGATRWLSPNRAAIHLSLRHRSDDQLWFTFFHEGCHVLEHKARTIYIDMAGDKEDSEAERRANEFARDLLLPPGPYEEFVSVGTPTLARVKRFAARMGVSPGIVVGRLQFDGLLARDRGNKLKRWFKWEHEEQGK